MNVWLTQTTALGVYLTLRQRQLLQFFIGKLSLGLALKVACAIMKVRAKSWLIVAKQLFGKNDTLCFQIKRFVK